MKSYWNQLSHLIISLSLVVSSSSFVPRAFAQTDTSLDDQKATCAKNSAAEWSAKMNRCVAKVEAQDTRNAVEDCAKITDLTQRAECHKSLAEQKTGLSSNPDSLNQGNTDKSAIMNGINTAYATLNFINMFGSKKKETNCMSKKIFGVTALAGTLSDFYLKARAKSKISKLTNKYKLDANATASAAQITAFEYLKDEQNTVADIASMEKKRNMVLMIGYGAATAMAIYELTPMGANPDCLKVEKSCKEDPSQASCKQTCTDGTTVSIDAKCPVAPEAKPEAKPTEKPANDDEEDEEEEKKDPTPAAEETKCPEGKHLVGTGCVVDPVVPKDPVVVVQQCADKTHDVGGKCIPDPVVPEKQIPVENNEAPVVDNGPPAKDCINVDSDGICSGAAPKREATIMATTKKVNGKDVAFYSVADPEDPSKKYDIVDKKVYVKGTTKVVGNLDYNSGAVTFNTGPLKPFTVTDVKLNSGNSAFVPSGSFAQIHNKVKGG